MIYLAMILLSMSDPSDWGPAESLAKAWIRIRRTLRRNNEGTTR